MRKLTSFLPAIFILLAAPAFADDAADAPRQALLNFVKATRTGDVKAMQAGLYVEPAAVPQVATLLALYQATAHLRQSMTAKFGDEATRAGWGLDAAFEARDKALANAQVKVTDDRAVLIIPAGDDHKEPQEITCRKLGDTWKVDAQSLFALDQPKAKESIAALKKTADLFHRVAADIDAGKLGTLQAAQTAIAQGTKEITDQPAPATQPQAPSRK